MVVFCATLLHAYDLSQVQIEKLQNGLTVMILEDHLQPLVSTQILYKVGSRNECVGSTGLAHFVEHMSFRATKNFPDTDVVSRIYAVGGEWHGYTWIDETTYFETVPVKDLDLVLQIQADRMHNALINASEVEAERGAVITELHSYENDPASVLYTASLAVSFLQHPYRYDSIGWISDVQRISHDDIVNFYHRYYNPSNAVLAVVGDVNSSDVSRRVHRYFDTIPAGESNSMPRTREPGQAGERRVTLNGPGSLNYFQITYRAPSANDADFPAFLLLQSVLGGSAGVNFRQKEEVEEAHPGTRLFGIGRKIGTYFIPTADPYAFVISGSSDRSTDRAEIERVIERRIAGLREKGVAVDELDHARKQALAELVFDIETTEDATHQLAYFEGIGAFPVLQKLPELLKSVTADEVQRVAQKYLQPEQRTVGWYVTVKTDSALRLDLASHPQAAKKDLHEGSGSALLLSPHVKQLKNGIVLMVLRIPRTPAGFLRILVPSNTVEVDQEYTPDHPVWRYTSFQWRFLKEDFQSTVAEARKLFQAPLPRADTGVDALEDPEYRLNRTLEELLGASPNQGSDRPAVMCVSGDVEEREAFSTLKKAFVDLSAFKKISLPPLQVQEEQKTVRLPGKAQSQIGYAVPAPATSETDSYAYRLLLYILTHGYEGRLGKELITHQGLIYYISSKTNSDGRNAWISISFGVDPDKLDPARAEFFRLMSALRENPPTESEIAEAREHLIGRRLTGSQSNEELSAFYVREWIEQGRLLTPAEFEKRVRAVSLEQVRRIIPSFLNGVTAIVDTR